MKEQQYSRLNTSEDGLSDLDRTAVTIGNRGPATIRRRTFSIVVILLVLSNLTFVTLWLRGKQPAKDADCVRPQLTYSPAREAIKYERRRLFRDITPKNDFAGLPRPELDTAWRKLLEPIAIKVTPEELNRANLSDPTIAFKDGSGYIAEVAVYHELHCVKRIRRAFHMDYYYPNMTDAARAFEIAHINHCLEYWREAAMCRGDISLASFFWRKDGPTSHAWSDHECVNWDSLDSWMRTRMIDVRDFEALEKPDESELPDVPVFSPVPKPKLDSSLGGGN